MLDRLLDRQEPVADTSPTFSSRWDRATYLLAEYKWPLIVVFIAVLIVYSTQDARIPTPPDVWIDFSVAAAIVAFPAYLAFAAAVKRLIRRRDIRVVEIGGPQEDTTPYWVPPRTWEDRDVHLQDAYRPPGSEQWHVWDLDWMGDVGQLEVTGIWQATAHPAEVHKSQAKVDAIWMDMIRELIKANASEALLAKRGVDIHDASMAEYLEMEEKGVLPDGVSVSDEIEKLESEIEGTLDIESIGEIEDSETEERLDDDPEPAPNDTQMVEDGTGGEF
jgi:hypothetical protein